jgi:pyruvate/2-oxoacid:ferredoxin oxidoreductase alpha subunit
MDSVKEIALRVDQEFREMLGRGYGIVEPVMVEDAETVIVTAGSITSTARLVIKDLRKQGHKVGLLKLRLFRPFPREAVQQILKGKKKIAVIDRNISLGNGGIFCQELRGALVHSLDHPWTFSYIAGVGGTDVTPEVIQKIAADAIGRTKPWDPPIGLEERQEQKLEHSWPDGLTLPRLGDRARAQHKIIHLAGKHRAVPACGRQARRLQLS